MRPQFQRYETENVANKTFCMHAPPLYIHMNYMQQKKPHGLK